MAQELILKYAWPSLHFSLPLSYQSFTHLRLKRRSWKQFESHKPVTLIVADADLFQIEATRKNSYGIVACRQAAMECAEVNRENVGSCMRRLWE
jgi:hypothetical protein